jgi:hypothetical protein
MWTGDEREAPAAPALPCLLPNCGECGEVSIGCAPTVPHHPPTLPLNAATVHPAQARCKKLPGPRNCA